MVIYLSQERLIRVIRYPNKELLGASLTKESECYTINNFRQRFECREGRPLNAMDSVLTIKNIVMLERTMHLARSDIELCWDMVILDCPALPHRY